MDSVGVFGCLRGGGRRGPAGGMYGVSHYVSGRWCRKGQAWLGVLKEGAMMYLQYI